MRGVRGLQDVDPVDGFDLDASDPDRLGPSNDLLVEASRRLRAGPCCRGDPGSGAGGQDDRGRHDRAGQRSAADFVEACDPSEPGAAQLVLVGEDGRRGVGGRAATSGPGRSPDAHRISARATLAESGRLADALAQEVELGAAGDTVADDLDLLDARGMHRERALDAAADATDGDGLVYAAASHPHDRPLEHLDALSAAFNDLDRDAHGVTGCDLGDIGRSCSRSSSWMGSMLAVLATAGSSPGCPWG